MTDVAPSRFVIELVARQVLAEGSVVDKDEARSSGKTTASRYWIREVGVISRVSSCRLVISMVLPLIPFLTC